jgi:hypothetical protein
MKRRQFVATVATTSVIGALGGCISGSGGGGNSSNNSSGNGNANGSSDGNSSGSGTQVNAFGERPRFDGQNLYIPVHSEVNIDKVQLRDANKQIWGTDSVKNVEGSAKFTLIKQSGGNYQKYPYGNYEIYAIKNGTQVDAGNFDIRPQFEVTEVASAGGGELRVTLKNVGSGSAVITGARLYRQGTNPSDNDGWSTGVFEGYEPEIVPPGGSTTVPVVPIGFGDVYAEGTDEATPQGTSGTVCSSEMKPAVVDYRMFGNIQSGPQLTLRLSGGRSKLDRRGIGCKNVSIQSKSGSNSSSSEATNSTNGSQ